MTTKKEAVDIHLLTTDVLLSELISGRAVSVGGDKDLALKEGDTRNVLEWYRQNRGRWAGNLNAGDVEAIIDRVGIDLPEPVECDLAHDVGVAQVLYLKKVVAYRFAGLHAYGRSNLAPELFEFEPSKPITLFEGANGSGKTSIANAVVWCLTGHLIRSQRPPEEGPTEFECQVTRLDGGLSTHLMSAVTPLVDAHCDLPSNGDPIPADTWVELTFEDENGNALPPLRREQSRTPRGKIVETSPALSSIGVDPIAWRIATTMPALLPFLAVGSASQLGQAVAKLTGLADLVDLAKHAGKASERISKKSIKELETDRERYAIAFWQAEGDLKNAIEEYKDMAFEGAIPKVDAVDAQDRLKSLFSHFSDMKADGLAKAKGVLGETFDPESKPARDDLEKSIRPAIEQLQQHLSALPSIARLAALRTEQPDIEKAKLLLQQLLEEAVILGELAANPGRAQRTQLYARVAGWMHDHGHPKDGKCPVCINELKGQLDPLTGEPISSQLEEAENNREVLARTLAGWISHWQGKLLSELPKSLADESRRDLPAVPALLLSQALTTELFETDSFKGTLLALQSDATDLVESRISTLPGFQEPAKHALPESISSHAKPLLDMINRTMRAITFADWTATHRAAMLEFLQFVRKGVEGDVDAERALSRRLHSLLAIVEGVSPLNQALEFVGRLEKARKDYSQKSDRIASARRAALALDELVPLGDLAQVQVDSLRKQLHVRSEFWRKALFRNATASAPDLSGTKMDAKGVLELEVGRDGAVAPAQHISNASALRGALMGFLLAFREYVLSTRGGLATLVLDDPQELLDNDNRERLARGITQVAKAGAQMLVTTYDRKFARSLVAENRADDRIEHLSVHPVNVVRPTLKASPAIEEVDRKRQAFADNPDSASHAQDYAADLRVFLESRLGDLFDDFPYPAHSASTKALTLNPLMDKLRGLVASKANELFVNPIVVRFANDPALAEGAEPRRVLNEAHHDKASISYMDVKAVEEAFGRLRTSVERVHEQFRLYRWREPNANDADLPTTVVPFKPLSMPSFSVPVCADIAAFVGHLPEGADLEAYPERVSGEWFEGKALFYVRGDSLGFALPSGSVAIVEAEPYAGQDQHLVIAQVKSQTFARRLVISSGAIGVSLATQMPDPRNRRPTLTFDQSKIRLHRIVGMIFTEMPPPTGGGEATEVQAVPELQKIRVAYRVKEESAIPLALPGQVILGGDEILISELDRYENEVVAVTLRDGTSILKRVGEKLPGQLSVLRQFETIGGLGASTVVATEDTEGEGASVPVLASARRVVGILYEGV